MPDPVWDREPRAAPAAPPIAAPDLVYRAEVHATDPEGDAIAAYALVAPSPAGATLVQLYSMLVYEGPPLVRRIKDELAALLARDGFASVGAAVGADL